MTDYNELSIRPYLTFHDLKGHTSFYEKFMSAKYYHSYKEFKQKISLRKLRFYVTRSCQ